MVKVSANSWHFFLCLKIVVDSYNIDHFLPIRLHRVNIE